jgi:SAM-dependent methyltransferase/predicted DNA-binding transcriptional regulator
MSKKNLQSILLSIGLTENESLVYLAGLSLGSTTILKLARSSGLKRTTVYSVVEDLKRRGLMNIEMRGFKKLYSVESPEKLEHILEERKETFKKELPEFLALYNLKGEDGVIRYYEGLEAIKGIYMGFLDEMRPHDDYLVVANQEKWFNLDPKFFLKYKEERAKKNVKTRLLFQDSPVAREHKKFQKNWNENVKILPQGTKLNTDLVIMPSKVIVFSLDVPLVAFVIENKNFVSMQKEMFELLWGSINEWIVGDLESENLKRASYDDTLLSLIGDVRNKKILDYGSGPGILAGVFKLKGANVKVWDTDPYMRENAELKIGQGNSYDSASSIPKNYFDLVVCNLVLCIVSEDEVENILKNIHDVVTKEGSVYIGFCNPKIFNINESNIDYRFKTGDSYETNHKYEKIKKEGGYKIIESHRPIEWYQKVFKAASLELTKTHFSPKYMLGEKEIEDYVIFELRKI